MSGFCERKAELYLMSPQLQASVVFQGCLAYSGFLQIVLKVQHVLGTRR